MPPQAAELSDPGIASDVANDLTNGSLSYSAELSILEDAAVGGMTASKFSTLETFASELNRTGGISVSPYVQQITDDVIFGNSANATWNGGAATATTLGSLTAASTQTQADELIGEWFLGTNLPSLDLASVGESNLSPTYQTSTLPLYGPSGAPTYQDVNQGYLGDCYFVSSLGEVALKYPSAIENMISSNGNGTYSVRFFVNGQPDYVTVNSELPMMTGYEWANGSQLEFANGKTDDWVALVEKAYAQLNAQTNAPHGMELNSAWDSYAGITAGDGSALTLITNQSETPTTLSPSTSASSLGSILTNLASSFSAGEEVLMSTPTNSSGDLVGGHMYMVTGVNAATGTLTIQNPWNTAYSGSLSMNFSETIQQLAADNCTLWVTSGSPVVTPTSPIAIATNGTTTLAQIGNQFELETASGGTEPFVTYNGTAVTTGEFGGWTPVGAEKTASGYEVAWSVPGANEYTVWNTDANGDYTGSATGVVSGTSPTLEGVEANFGENFSGAGAAASSTTIATNGTTTLAQVGNLFELNPASGGTGPLLEYQGSLVTAGQFGGWTPIGAEKTANGYEVAWSVPGANEYTVWNTYANGSYAGSVLWAVSGTSYALESLELSFGEDLNGDGTIGPTTTTIATNGTTTLMQVANEYELGTASGGTGPFVTYNGSAVTTGEFGGWTPVGAEKTASGYEVAWSVPGANEYTVWNADANGDYTGNATGVVSGTSPTLEGVEANFGENFSGAGAAASPTMIATNGTTTLAQVGNLFELNPASGGTGPLLEYQGSLVTAGQFGGWTPIGAEKTANGYEVAWSVPGANEYTVWNTDANGDYTVNATGILSGDSSTLEGVEANFGENFTGSGAAATPTTIAANGTTTLAQVGNLFELNAASGGTGPLLEYQGSLVTAGEFGGWTPVGAEKTRSGYEVAWSVPGANEYMVWNTDGNGNYTGNATGVVSGQSSALEDLEPAFSEDLNGNGRLSALLVTSAGAGNILDLSGQTQAATINLSDNSASAPSLTAPSLSFNGTPDAITLGSDQDTIEYALTPSSGIETIANFILGQDELNIDLGGAPASALQFHDTTVSGMLAVAIMSSADPGHGLVLLNPAGDTAATLLAHTTFTAGHALIS
jgi:hypothetical protein